ncbi:MAG: hypothetical protein U0451_02800 [Candidatus Saccharimonadales bacterium]
MLKHRQRGDTIVEVLMCLAALGFVMMITYSISTRSLQLVRQSQERLEALKIAEGQIELLKNLQRNNLEGTATEPNGFKDVADRVSTQPFCMDADTYNAIVFTIPPDEWNSDILADQLKYPSGCDSIGPGGLYNVAIIPPDDSQGGVFKVYVRWQKINGGTNEQVTLEYKLYEAN